MPSGASPAVGLLRRGVWLVGLLLLAAPPGVTGQGIGSSPAPGDSGAAAGAAARSLILPGWGQKELGQRRGVVYALAEATFWTLWAERRHSGNQLRTAFKDLAWREARLQGGSRNDPAWAYFETLSKWTRSGAFDGDAATSGVQPETDPATFNGSMWRLALDIYFPQDGTSDPHSPAYASALAWYTEHAYGSAFLWDWSGKEGPLAEYKDLIHRSDHRFSQATAALGAVLANHLLSATDAFVSARVPGDARLSVIPPAPGDALGTYGIILAWTPPW